MSTNPRPRSHGSGCFSVDDFRQIGDGVVIEEGVLVFHPENIVLGPNVYVGHQTILKGYYKNTLEIGANSWIGQQCFLHSAGGLYVGRNVGIGPGVRIITSRHEEEGRMKPILRSRLSFSPVTIGDDCDLGTGTIILPGVTLGKGVQTGAGAVVAADVPDYAVAVGVPARVIRIRD
jgi:acetyltransferase-like isoleucine patch superfamily enzyme